MHEFWPDDISLLDPGLVDATRHAARFVTFDASVALEAVRGARPVNVLRL